MIAIITQKLAERKLSREGRTEVVNAYIATVIYYRLTDLPCSGYRIIILERILFRFLRKRHVPMVRWHVCYQHLLCGSVDIP